MVKLRGGGEKYRKVMPGMDKDSCEKLDGHHVKLDDGTEICIWLKDDEGKPIDVESTELIGPGRLEVKTAEGKTEEVKI